MSYFFFFWSGKQWTHCFSVAFVFFVLSTEFEFVGKNKRLRCNLWKYLVSLFLQLQGCFVWTNVFSAFGGKCLSMLLEFTYTQVNVFAKPKIEYFSLVRWLMWKSILLSVGSFYHFLAVSASLVRWRAGLFSGKEDLVGLVRSYHLHIRIRNGLAQRDHIKLCSLTKSK